MNNVEPISSTDLVLQFKPLIHKTIHRLHIKQSHNDYDDFFQELQIQLIEIFHKFTSQGGNLETERFKFTAYAGKGLYWHGINLLRKKDFNDESLTNDDHLDFFNQLEEEGKGDLPSHLLIDDFLRQAKLRLSQQDYLLLLHIIEDRHTVPQLAEMMRVSKDTIYQRKKKIRSRLQDIKECLMN